ncbi:hypothetical protein [Dehalococcoides sp.]|jgi:hypothetical protein|uniref:hypothetical protein n=1 Tax=Dehalococcoides sp. TaxID=1966486 RepID=UPI0002B76816|nr:hypothetical protein [Dehalococcoides sp.]AGG05741.1 hypothetical protein dcmb_108 [Dehalococcoides mccartyi DCMB5]BEL00212.1 hypothetical protein DMOBY_00650 [Dehalococcoides mccartyi]
MLPAVETVESLLMNLSANVVLEAVSRMPDVMGDIGLSAPKTAVNRVITKRLMMFSKNQLIRILV